MGTTRDHCNYINDLATPYQVAIAVGGIDVIYLVTQKKLRVEDVGSTWHLGPLLRVNPEILFIGVHVIRESQRVKGPRSKLSLSPKPQTPKVCKIITLSPQ